MCWGTQGAVGDQLLSGPYREKLWQFPNLPGKVECCVSSFTTATIKEHSAALMRLKQLSTLVAKYSFGDVFLKLLSVSAVLGM